MSKSIRNTDNKTTAKRESEKRRKLRKNGRGKSWMVA